jgi:hypothetical protein
VAVDAEALFQKLLRDLQPIFKKNGFRKMSQNFVLETSECWAVVNFQKSQWSYPGEKKFYVNVAVSAKRVLAFQGDSPTKAPRFYVCDWRWRAEQFGPDNATVKDWTIRDEETAAMVLRYLENLFRRFVIPELRSLLSEDALVARAGVNPGYPQGKACSVLLAANAKTESLRQMIAYLLETFGGTAADGLWKHLEQMRNQFPEQMRKIEVP